MFNVILKPKNLDSNHYFTSYIERVPENELLLALNTSQIAYSETIAKLSPKDGEFRYQPNKWNVKQLLLHLNDTERILAYRALRLSRKDNTPLAGFDENHYATHDYNQGLEITDIHKEFLAIRNQTIALFKNMNPEVIEFKSITNNMPSSPLLLGWMIVGHQLHHLEVLRDRYKIGSLS